MPCTDDPDLFSVGCFGSVESAQGVKSFLWEEHAIVSALKTVMVGPFPVVRLLVAKPDFPEALKLISSLDQTEWGWMPPERYTSVVKEVVDRLIFLDDKPTEGEQPGSGHGFAADVPGRKEKVIEQIRMMFGEEEARRMVAAFDSSEQASDTRPEASVVMLMHNKWKHTERALWGLLQTRNVRWELILVDNGSTDKEVKNGVTS